MKKLFFAVVSLVFVLGCSNDFELTDAWKDIPVVYGFLNQKDTAHYVRVEKAFLDPVTSALTIAKIADSLYYKDATVFLERGSDNKRFQLERVDGALEGYPRDTGIFAQNPNILYKIKQSTINLKPGETCKVIIERGENLPEVTGQTVILGALEISTPKQSITGVHFKTGDQFSMTWIAPTEAQIFDLSATIRIREEVIGSTEVRNRTLNWSIARNVKRNPGSTSDFVSKSVPGSSFFKFLADNLTPDPTVNRYITSTGIDFRVDGAGAEVNEYNDVLNANSGISGAELIPVYTNMSEGFGLFPSRGFIIEKGYGPNQVTRDSLIGGQYTRNLGFK